MPVLHDVMKFGLGFSLALWCFKYSDKFFFVSGQYGAESKFVVPEQGLLAC